MFHKNNFNIMKKIALMSMLWGLTSMSIMADNTSFKVINMSCEGCAKRIKKTLKANKAVSEVNINLDNKMVAITFDGTKVKDEELRGLLAKEKFVVEAKKHCGGGCHKEAAQGQAGGHCKKNDGQGKGCCKEKKAAQEQGPEF